MIICCIYFVFFKIIFAVYVNHEKILQRKLPFYGTSLYIIPSFAASKKVSLDSTFFNLEIRAACHLEVSNKSVIQVDKMEFKLKYFLA